MREILFRGKRIDNGEWVYGVAFPHDNAGGVTMFFQHPLDGSLEGREVEPSTVGQYTGLTDNNGKKIFEGDILSVLLDFEHGRTIKGIAEYKIDCFRIKYNNPNGVGALTLNPISYERNHIIIGNIHDDPELLEAEE